MHANLQRKSFIGIKSTEHQGTFLPFRRLSHSTYSNKNIRCLFKSGNPVVKHNKTGNYAMHVMYSSRSVFYHIMESLGCLIIQLSVIILFLFGLVLLSFSLYILYQRRIKFGHIPGPPVSSFLKGMLEILVGYGLTDIVNTS